jgi:hypothetical protein
VPRTELPSGAWVEYRDRLMGCDQEATQGSFEIRVVDGQQIMPSNVQGLMRRALLAEIITSWGGPGLEGIPVPSQNQAGAEIIGKVLDVDDMNALTEAVAPLLEKVAFATAPKKGGVTPSSS